jgi:hypothetical protein
MSGDASSSRLFGFEGAQLLPGLALLPPPRSPPSGRWAGTAPEVGRGTVPSHRSGMRDDLAGPVSAARCRRGRFSPSDPKRSSEHRPERGTTGSRPRSPGRDYIGTCASRQERSAPASLARRFGPTGADDRSSNGVGCSQPSRGHPVGRRWNGTLRGRVGSAHSLHSMVARSFPGDPGWTHERISPARSPGWEECSAYWGRRSSAGKRPMFGA